MTTEPKTATVSRVVVPTINHLTAENLVQSDAAGKKPGQQGSATAAMEDLSGSSSSDEEEEADMEQYEREPSIRRPGSRSNSEDLDIDADEYNEELVPPPERGTEVLRRQKQGLSSDDWKVAADSGVKVRPEDFVSGPAAVKKKGVKKGARPARLGVGEGETKGLHHKGFDPEHSPSLSEDVWKEAMAAVPLASSESFDMHLLSKDRPAARLDDDAADDDNDAFERRPGRRKGKKLPAATRSNADCPSSDLQWSADLPINDSLSRDTLDDISCDSYVPPQQIDGWDVNSSLEVNLDDYMEDDGTAKVLDMLVRTPDSDSTHGRVVGRRRERVDRENERKRTLSTSFETNIDDIPFDTEPRSESVSNIGKDRQAADGKLQTRLPGVSTDVAAVNQNVSNINKPERKEKRSKPKDNKNVSNIDKGKELSEDTTAQKKRRQKQPPAEEMAVPEEGKFSGKGKKRKEPSEKRSATIPIMAADAAPGSLPFEDDEESYSG